ncbi:MAG: TetR/AcrR family transcriptional regulator [Bdellovibrionota bacterium]
MVSRVRSRAGIKPGVKTGLDGILKKSSRLMARKGYSATTMRNLAQETGRSLAGLYHYFRNKEELLWLINMRGFSSLLESAQEISGRRDEAEKKLLAFINSHVSYFTTHVDEMKVMLFSTQQLGLARGKAIRELRKKYASLGHEIVGEFVARHAGQRACGMELHRKSFLLFGMMNWICRWYTPKEYGSLDELVSEIYKTFTRGVLSGGSIMSQEVNVDERAFDHRAM